MDIPVKILRLRPDSVIPSYNKPGDSGFDFCCPEEITIPPGEVAIIPTGLAIALPDGCELQIRMRSGASLKTPLLLANSPGTIDAGYRGEIGIIVRNLSITPYTVAKGERIAQGVIAPVFRAVFEEVSELPISERGTNGFGSTGKNWADS